METLLTISVILILYLFHEMGHVLSAYVLGVKIYKVGISLSPYPHFCVEIEEPESMIDHLIFLFSGSFTTLSLFVISLTNRISDIKAIFLALIYQIIIETNPFYSDITIAVSGDRKNEFKKEKYIFTKEWYFHFLLWIVLIVILFKIYNK